MGEKICIPGVYYAVVLKHNLMSIGQLLQKRYKVYMEDNYCVIRDIHPSKQLILKVQMIGNHLLPSRIRPYMKGETTQVVHEALNEN